MKTTTRGLVALLLWAPLLSLAGSDSTTSPEPILDTWLEKQAEVKSWSAQVVQTRTLKALARPVASDGRVWFVQPNRFRWQLGDPPRTVAVRTDDQLFVLYPKLGQAERYGLGEGLDPAWQQALALLEVGFPSDREAFYARYDPVSATRSGDHWRFVLLPAAREARRLIERVELEVSADNFTLRSTELVFPDGSTMRNEFREHRLNPDVDESLFQVDLDSYDVVNPLQ
jgi:outer membrane lipoprotein-sorting protein